MYNKFQYQKLDLNFLNPQKPIEEDQEFLQILETKFKNIDYSNEQDNFMLIHQYFDANRMISDYKFSIEELKTFYDNRSEEFKQEYNFDQYRNDYISKVLEKINKNKANTFKQQEQVTFEETGYDENDYEISIFSNFYTSKKIIDVLLKKAYEAQNDQYKKIITLDKFKDSLLRNSENLEKSIRKYLLKEIYDQNKHLSLIIDFKQFKVLCETIHKCTLNDYYTALIAIADKVKTRNNEAQIADLKQLTEVTDNILFSEIQLLENFINTSKILFGSVISYDLKNQKIKINEKEFDFSESEQFSIYDKKYNQNIYQIQKKFDSNFVIVSYFTNPQKDKISSLSISILNKNLSNGNDPSVTILYDFHDKKNVEILVKFDKIDIQYNTKSNRIAFLNHDRYLETKPLKYKLTFNTKNEILDISFKNLSLENSFTIDNSEALKDKSEQKTNSQ